MGQHPTEQLRYGRIQNVNPKTIVKGLWAPLHMSATLRHCNKSKLSNHY